MCEDQSSESAEETVGGVESIISGEAALSKLIVCGFERIGFIWVGDGSIGDREFYGLVYMCVEINSIGKCVIDYKYI